MFTITSHTSFSSQHPASTADAVERDDEQRESHSEAGGGFLIAIVGTAVMAQFDRAILPAEWWVAIFLGMWIFAGTLLGAGIEGLFGLCIGGALTTVLAASGAAIPAFVLALVAIVTPLVMTSLLSRCPRLMGLISAVVVTAMLSLLVVVGWKVCLMAA